MTHVSGAERKGKGSFRLYNQQPSSSVIPNPTLGETLFNSESNSKLRKLPRCRQVDKIMNSPSLPLFLFISSPLHLAWTRIRVAAKPRSRRNSNTRAWPANGTKKEGHITLRARFVPGFVQNGSLRSTRLLVLPTCRVCSR